MTILQFMLKAPLNICSRSHREQCIIEKEEEEEDQEEKVEVEEVLTLDTTSEPEIKSTFTVLLRREDSRACFSNTLQLKHLTSLKYLCCEERISFRRDVASCCLTSSSSPFSPLSISSSSSAFSPLSISSSASKISNKNWTNRKTSVSSNSATTTLQRSSYSDGSLQNSLNTEGSSRFGQWITSDSEYVVLEL